MKFTYSIDEEVQGVIKKVGSKREVRHERVGMHRFHLHKVQNQANLVYGLRCQKRTFLWGEEWGLWNVWEQLLGSRWCALSWWHRLISDRMAGSPGALPWRKVIQLYNCNLYTFLYACGISYLLLPKQITPKCRGWEWQYLLPHSLCRSGIQAWLNWALSLQGLWSKMPAGATVSSLKAQLGWLCVQLTDVAVGRGQLLVGCWTESLSCLLAVGQRPPQSLATWVSPTVACFTKALKSIRK